MSAKSLFNVRKLNKVITVCERDSDTALIAMTEMEAIDMIRALSSALNKPINTFIVLRDAKGRGE